jgi:uncharacterized protein
MKKLREITPQTARRLAIAAQHLSGSQEAMLPMIRRLGCLQIDPTSAVARSHTLVLWSRLGAYDNAEFERLMWHERHLLEYWAHAASVVLTENYPLHRIQMRQGTADTSSWGHRLREWVKENDALRQHVLNELEKRGPMQLKDFEGHELVTKSWQSSGWTMGRNVDRMVDYLWTRGEIMVAGRKGTTRLWDLAERVLPSWTPRDELDNQEIVKRALLIALRAMGLATAKQINYHFIRNNYPEKEQLLSVLEQAGQIERVKITGDANDYYVGDVPLLEKILAGAWQPRTTLLSPFDNLICDRTRTETLFNFKFSLEIYVPKHKRQYGYFVMPILHGDQLIGRIDPLMDRKTSTLRINAVHWEASPSDEARRATTAAIESLGGWLGAKQIEYAGEGGG